MLDRRCWFMCPSIAWNRQEGILSIIICKFFKLLMQVKVSFCLVGHTHEDIDAIIGTVVSHLRGKNLETFEDLKRESIESIVRQKALMHGVDMLVGVPDYGKHFEGANGEEVVGLQSAHEFRISSNSTCDGVQLHYKELVSDVGWLPRPVPVSDTFSSSWATAFESSKKNQGKPVIYT